MTGYAYSWRTEYGRCPVTNKRVMPSLKFAKVSAANIGVHGGYYKCPHCRKYHLTHYDTKSQKAIAAVLSIRA